jgi:hypothetical protein
MDRLLKDSPEFVSFLDSRVSMCKLACDEFAKDFSENPGHALSWSQSTFERAAELTVVSYVKEAVKAGKATFRSLQEHAKRETLKKAMYPSHSTSPVSNLMAVYTLAAWAQMVEWSEAYGKD